MSSIVLPDVFDHFFFAVAAVFGLRRVLRGERGDGSARFLVRLVQAAGTRGCSRISCVNSAFASSQTLDVVSVYVRSP